MPNDTTSPATRFWALVGLQVQHIRVRFGPCIHPVCPLLRLLSATGQTLGKRRRHAPPPPMAASRSSLCIFLSRARPTCAVIIEGFFWFPFSALLYVSFPCFVRLVCQGRERSDGMGWYLDLVWCGSWRRRFRRSVPSVDN
jgi:hypothetical protein